ncbi:hypothetical protein ANCCAN_18257 [Ancylostoma caninum]|uniref:Uncharacterized protein n=1 Tax=Ancylostoma caninum TaxID=29170 RepID=A0A368FUJ5_ANCCA|nr:hypothetical protein ANCCAN_18257 [Ancylostoma caninum]
MSPLLLCLALTVFAYAAPPFVPVKPEPVEHAAPSQADPCVDGVNNVVQIADINKPTLRIRTQDAVAQLYDANGNPSCYKGRAKISLPGLVKLVKGKVIVTAPSDIRKSGEVLFTYTKNQRFVGTLCKDGKVLNKLIPAEACRQKLYPFIGEEFATMLSTPGTYDMEEIRKTAGVGPMVELPPINSAINMIVRVSIEQRTTLRIRTQDAVAQLYDANGNPSCYKGRAKISLPGLVKLVKGKVIVTTPSDIRKSGEVLFTYTKNQRFVGTLCKDGKVLNKLIPAEACRQKLYPFIGEEFATMLSTPGTYDMEEIRKTAGVGPMVVLPPINSAINMIVRGDWQATLNLVSEGKTIALVKAPSNGEWLYVD